MNPEIRPLAEGELEAAHACYRRNGYQGTIQPSDDALVAVQDGAILGVVRLAHEQGAQILRGMFLDEAARGRRLGTRMLEALEARMSDARCWVICGPHLIRFYGRIGFRLVVPARARRTLPGHLRSPVSPAPRGGRPSRGVHPAHGSSSDHPNVGVPSESSGPFVPLRVATQGPLG
jgi:GNAT superfamily N-acetyltransferase